MSTHEFSLRQIGPEDWSQVTKQFSDLTFEQTSTYGKAAAERVGAADEYWIIEHEGAPVSAAVVRIKRIPLIGHGIAWIASGPLLQKNGRPPVSDEHLQTILSTFRAEFADRQGHVFRFRPSLYQLDSQLHDPVAFEEAATKAGFQITCNAPTYQTVVTRLDKGEENLMSSLHGKWRGHLRKALKQDLELDVGEIGELSKRFESLYTTVSQEKGFAPEIPPSFYYHLGGPDFTHKVLIAKKDGRDLGAITLGLSGSNATYLFGATNDEGRRANAGYFLTWNGYLRAREWGILNYDLGGIDAETNPMVTEFKRRAGGIELRAPGPFESVSGRSSAKIVLTLEKLAKSMRIRKA